MNLPTKKKVFQSQFDLKSGYKMLNKNFKKSVDSGDFERERVRVRERAVMCRTSNKIKECWHSTKSSPTFPTLDQDRLLLTDPRHTTVPQIKKKQPPKNNLHPITSWPLSGERRKPVKEDLHLLTSWPVTGRRREPVSLLTYWLLFI